MNILIYIEIKDGELVSSSIEAITPAKQLGNACAVVAGDADAAAKAAVYGVPVVCMNVDGANPDAVVGGLVALAKEKSADVVAFAGTLQGKDLAPRVASRLATGCVTDVTAIEEQDGALLVKRPAFGGSVIECLKNNGPVQVFTIRGGSFEKPEAGEAAAVEAFDPGELDIKVKVLEVAKELTEAVNLESAEIVVSGGRGMGDAENFALVEQLADVLGATVGASRPAVESGWASRAHQVGQSGKIIAPKLYIACGISGSMQHVAGMIASKYIIAVNKDPDAAIFGIADLGIVGDVKKILPMLTEEIKKRK